MKLLFDQNLSPRLPGLLADLYPDSAHIRELGMRDSTDTEIWEYAKANGFAIVSKDSTFKLAVCCMGILRNSYGCELAIVR
jgi:predicted nuclease of predicted toxin-antitoxin system